MFIVTQICIMENFSLYARNYYMKINYTDLQQRRIHVKILHINVSR